MSKLGIVVGENKWGFFGEIFGDLATHFQTDIFRTKTFELPLLYGRLNRWALRYGLRSIMRRNDICFFEWASDYLVIASHMPKYCPIVTRLHSFELYEWASQVNWEHVDKIIVVSEAMEQMFCELYPEQSDKTKVIYNGRPLDEFKPPSQRNFRFRIGMLCSILPIKRVYEVVLMLSDLRKQGHDARLHIAGRPEGDLRYAAAVYRLAEKLDLQDSVTFEGYVTDTPAWLKSMDIFISNSFWEGQQVALIEAMASGCYCLSHRWAGVEEMLPEEHLFFTEAELQQKIIDYARLSPEEKLGRCEAMRTIACSKFNIERTKAEIREVIDAELAEYCLPDEWAYSTISG